MLSPAQDGTDGRRKGAKTQAQRRKEQEITVPAGQSSMLSTDQPAAFCGNLNTCDTSPPGYAMGVTLNGGLSSMARMGLGAAIAFCFWVGKGGFRRPSQTRQNANTKH